MTGWMIGAALAADPGSAEPSRALRAVTATGVVVGGAGAALTSLVFLDRSPEPYLGVYVGATFGFPTLAVGTALTAGGSCAQSFRVRANRAACAVSLGLLGATAVGTAIYVPITEAGTEPYPWPVLLGAGAGAWVAGMVQGGVNRHTWSGSLAVVPMIDRPGLLVVGEF